MFQVCMFVCLIIITGVPDDYCLCVLVSLCDCVRLAPFHVIFSSQHRRVSAQGLVTLQLLTPT